MTDGRGNQQRDEEPKKTTFQTWMRYAKTVPAAARCLWQAAAGVSTATMRTTSGPFDRNSEAATMASQRTWGEYFRVGASTTAAAVGGWFPPVRKGAAAASKNTVDGGVSNLEGDNIDKVGSVTPEADVFSTNSEAATMASQRTWGEYFREGVASTTAVVGGVLSSARKGVVSTKNIVVSSIRNLEEEDINKIGHATQKVFNVLLHDNTSLVVGNAVFTTARILWKRKGGEHTDAKNNGGEKASEQSENVFDAAER